MKCYLMQNYTETLSSALQNAPTYLRQCYKIMAHNMNVLFYCAFLWLWVSSTTYVIEAKIEINKTNQKTNKNNQLYVLRYTINVILTITHNNYANSYGIIPRSTT